MKEKFKAFRFTPATLAIVEKANEIIEDYQDQGFDLTLRQLYYQFVARDLIENSQKSYDRLGGIINNARLNGDIDWETIKDRTRDISNTFHWNTVPNLVSSMAYSFDINTRMDQAHYLEVWVEKEALIGVVERACRELDLPYFACRGYVSQTAMYDAAQRMQKKSDRGQEPVILHLGDHDPSGIDMTRDISERLNDVFGVPVLVERIALNMNQVEEFSPPPNPAKQTDSRCSDYIKRFGGKSWELDALEPKTITNLIKNHANVYTDHSKRAVLIEAQKEGKQLLRDCSKNWESVVNFLENI